MKSEIDLKTYFNRIGYSGHHTATIETLQALHELHPQSIAFENLNPFLRIQVRLDSNSLQKKMVYNRRGGYCFEHNLLFKHVLEALGFTVQGLAARILWNRSNDAITPRGHMLLLVKAEGENWIADVGFGGLTLTAPLRLDSKDNQATPHELFRLLQSEEGYYTVQAKVRDEWKSLYRFDLQEQHLPDYEISNWYLSNHPESHFITGLIAARSGSGQRFVLSNNELSIHHTGSDTEKQSLKTVDELRDALDEIFLLEMPERPDTNEKLQQLVISRSGEIL